MSSALPMLRLAGLAVLAVSWFAASPAHAQGCPPGTFQSGGGNAGWVGCAPVYDPWAGYAVDADPTPSWARGPSIDPLAGRIEAATTIFEMEAARYEELQRRLATDPQFAEAYRRYTHGVWEHFERSEQQQCAALFAREGNFVLMFETGGEQRGALLVFVGRDVPAPRTPERIRVMLRQNDDEQPQRVQAYNYRVPETELGAAALAVPSIEALIDNMLDTHRFALEADGQSIFAIEWHSGLASRDALARCAGRRG